MIPKKNSFLNILFYTQPNKLKQSSTQEEKGFFLQLNKQPMNNIQFKIKNRRSGFFENGHPFLD